MELAREEGIVEVAFGPGEVENVVGREVEVDVRERAEEAEGSRR
jgi:hypothetical protein